MGFNSAFKGLKKYGVERIYLEESGLCAVT